MADFLVTWSINVSADTPEQAAAEALAMQRAHGSIATMFQVIDERGDIHHIDAAEIRMDEPKIGVSA